MMQASPDSAIGHQVNKIKFTWIRVPQGIKAFKVAFFPGKIRQGKEMIKLNQYIENFVPI